MDDHCWADFGEVTLDCELPAGHDGPHRATLEWDPEPPRPPAPPIDPASGYGHFLRKVFGGIDVDGLLGKVPGA